MRRPRSREQHGGALLEVVLALSVFAVSASVLYTAFSSCGNAVRTERLGNRAVDLAVTVMSNVHLGIVDQADDGPNDFGEEYPELEGWEWTVAVEDTEDTLRTEPMERVTVTVGNPSENIYTRLVEIMPAGKEDADEEEEEEEGPGYLP